MGLLGRLHLVTDTRSGRDPLPDVRAAVCAAAALGVAPDLVVQVRVPDATTDRQAYQLTVAVLDLCRPAGVSCLVNDRLDVALAAGADGGHVGADDLPPAAARRVLGPAAVLGATARDPATAVAAVQDGASYLGVGPCHHTATKAGLPAPIGLTGLARVVAAVPGTPVVAIGGITPGRVPDLVGAGAHGVAVVGAVSSAADPARATTLLLRALGPAASRAGWTPGQAGPGRGAGPARTGGERRGAVTASPPGAAGLAGAADAAGAAAAAAAATAGAAGTADPAESVGRGRRS